MDTDLKNPCHKFWTCLCPLRRYRGRQILLQPCALSILGEVLCLCLLSVIGSFDTKHQHQTTECVCFSVHKTGCPQPSGKAEWGRHSDIGLFLLPSRPAASVSCMSRTFSHIVFAAQCTVSLHSKMCCKATTIRQSPISQEMRHKQSFWLLKAFYDIHIKHLVSMKALTGFIWLTLRSTVWL
jgi:hypothetical protein